MDEPHATDDNTNDTQRLIVGMDAHSDKLQICLCRWTFGDDPRTLRNFSTSLEALEETYRSQVPEGAETILEASTNAFLIVRRLRAIGYKATPVNSDVLAGMSRGDRINDGIDAYNLAKAYARGFSRAVHVPGEQAGAWRDILHGHRNAIRDCVRTSNRIWAFCSAHGLRYGRGSGPARCLAVRRQLDEGGFRGVRRLCIDECLLGYEQAWERRKRLRKAIDETVAGTPGMLRLMQLPGVGAIGAFAIVAYTEDVRRFASPKKLVAYFGLNPTVCSSGKSEGGHATSKRGNGAVRSILVECAQTTIRTGAGGVAKWARRALAQGKPYNKVVVAVARKLVVYAWHILMGHPAPSRESEGMFRHKLVVLASGVGKQGIRQMGYNSREDFSLAVSNPLYAHLPEADAAGESMQVGPATDGEASAQPQSTKNRQGKQKTS